MIIAIDTETGGFDPRADALLSVSLVMLDDNLVIGRKLDLFILPEAGKRISPEAARINGYTRELWEERKAVTLSAAVRTMASFIGDFSDPLAHNAVFDKGFIDQAATETGIKLPLSYRWRCSMVTMMAVDDAFRMRFPNCKLETLARISGHWGGNYERGAHQAADDAMACAVGYRWLTERMRLGMVAKMEAKP